MSTEQVSEFILEHRHTVREFDFENVFLINGGVWEDALAPLTRSSGSDEWLSQHSGSETGSSTGFQSQDYIDQLGDYDQVIDTAGEMRSEVLRTSVLVKKKRVHRRRRRKHKHKESSGKLVISSPIPIAGPIEEVLMPTTFNPHVRSEVLRTSVLVKKKRVHRRRRRKHKHKESSGKLVISSPIPIAGPIEEVLMPTTFNPHVQGVQRNAEMEAAQQELADDPDKRVSALKKAKEAVLKQLGKEYCRNQERKEHVRGFFKNTCSAGRKGRALVGHESTALVPLMFSRY